MQSEFVVSYPQFSFLFFSPILCVLFYRFFFDIVIIGGDPSVGSRDFLHFSFSRKSWVKILIKLYKILLMAASLPYKPHYMLNERLFKVNDDNLLFTTNWRCFSWCSSCHVMDDEIGRRTAIIWGFPNVIDTCKPARLQHIWTTFKSVKRRRVRYEVCKHLWWKLFLRCFLHGSLFPSSIFAPVT